MISTRRLRFLASLEVPASIGLKGPWEAIQILGGNGLSREYPIEKMFRDARASMIEDGVNESLALSAFEYL